MKCVQCILYCFEKSVKYISRLAFIQTAIKGTNFCSAAMAAMGFMFREAALVGMITSVTEFMMVMGKFVISLATGLLSFACIQFMLQGENKVSNSALPVLITMLFGFGIGSACLEVYETDRHNFVVFLHGQGGKRRLGRYESRGTPASVCGE